MYSSWKQNNNLFKIVLKRRGANMLNETMIQLILIAICCVYILFNTKADKNPKRGYRTALYLFVMAGIISYIMKYLNWLDFFLLITPIMCLFKFEDKWSQQHLTLHQVISSFNINVFKKVLSMLHRGRVKPHF